MTGIIFTIKLCISMYVFSNGVCQPFKILKMPRDEVDPNCIEDISAKFETDDVAPDPESYLSELFCTRSMCYYFRG